MFLNLKCILIKIFIIHSVLEGDVSDFYHVYVFESSSHCHCGRQLGTATGTRVRLTEFCILRRNSYELLSTCIAPYTDSEGNVIPHNHFAHMSMIYHDLVDAILPLQIINIRGGVRQEDPCPYMHTYVCDPPLRHAMGRCDSSNTEKISSNTIDLTANSTPSPKEKSQSSKNDESHKEESTKETDSIESVDNVSRKAKIVANSRMKKSNGSFFSSRKIGRSKEVW